MKAAGPVLAAVLAGWLVAAPAPGREPVLDKQKQQKLMEGIKLLSGARQAVANTRTMTALERQRWAFGIVEQPRLDQGLGAILLDLQRPLGTSAVPAKIHVMPDPMYQAYATGDGAIFIATGMLQSMESRDEVAALIAHEYVHILRNHSGQTPLQAASAMLGGVTSIYLDQQYAKQGAVSGNPTTDYVRNALLREVAMQSVQAGIIPSRSRKHEAEADLQGLDLMVAAGYNPIGMVDMLGRMELWEQQRQKRQSDQEPKLNALGVALHDYSMQSDVADRIVDKTGIGRGDLKNLLGGVLGAVNSKLDSARKRGHERSEDRMEMVRQHMEAKYADTDRPDLRPLPWSGDQAVAQLFTALGDLHSLVDGSGNRPSVRSREQLVSMIRSGPAGNTPLGRYVALSLHGITSGKGEEDSLLQQELERRDSLFAAHQLILDGVARRDSEHALTLLETSRKSLNDPPELLPYSVRLYRHAKRSEMVDSFMAQCVGTGDERLMQSCRQAR